MASPFNPPRDLARNPGEALYPSPNHRLLAAFVPRAGGRIFNAAPGRLPLPLLPTTNAAYTAKGLDCSSTAANGEGASVAAPTWLQVSAPITLALCMIPGSNTPNSATMFGTTVDGAGGATNPYGLVASSAGLFRLRWNSSTAISAASDTYQAHAGTYTTLVGTLGAAAQALYVNKVSLATGANVIGAFSGFGASSLIMMGFATSASGTTASGGTYLAGYILQGLWNLNEISQFHADPFFPVRRRSTMISVKRPATLVTPPTKALSLSTFAPVILTPRVVTPPTKSLSLTTFAPVIQTPRVMTPPVMALTLTKFAPVVLTPRTVTPPTKALTLTGFAPAAQTPRVITPPTKALTTTAFAPVISTPRTVTPPTKALTLTGLAPTVQTPRVMTPPTKAVVLTGLAPVVSTPRVVTPPAKGLTLTRFAPTILTPRTMTPGTASLTLTTFAPGAVTPRVVTPGTVALTLTSFAPVAGSSRLVTPGTAILVLTTFAPTVTAIATSPPVPPVPPTVPVISGPGASTWWDRERVSKKKRDEALALEESYDVGYAVALLMLGDDE